MRDQGRGAERHGRFVTLCVARSRCRIEELELDPPGPGEVLVRIRAAGLCHSDLSVINGDRPRPVPMALGHEAAGVVEELGARRGGPRPRRSRGLRVRAVLRPLRALRRGQARSVRAGCGRQRGRHAARRQPAGCTARTARWSTITWASRASPSTPPSRAARWSRSTRSCRSRRRPSSAAPCSPAWGPWPTPPASRSAPRWR